MGGWLPPGVTDRDIDEACPGYYDEPEPVFEIKGVSGFNRTFPSYLEGGADDSFVEQWAVVEDGKEVYLSRTYEGAVAYIKEQN
jgi:hypothetical protein